jgi:hypothetical protein
MRGKNEVVEDILTRNNKKESQASLTEHVASERGSDLFSTFSWLGVLQRTMAPCKNTSWEWVHSSPCNGMKQIISESI